MKIAQISPVYQSAGRQMTGNTHRVISWLAEGLKALGCEVTMINDNDNNESTGSLCGDGLTRHSAQMKKISERAGDFDILHFHNDLHHFCPRRLKGSKHITTLYGRLDIPAVRYVYDLHPELPVISLSDTQRVPMPDANWKKTIYPGIPEHLYDAGRGDGEYLLFYDNIAAAKRPDKAIEIAVKAGIPLIIAAKDDKVNERYFRDVLLPLLDNPLITYLPNVSEEGKKQLLQNALCLVCPMDWAEAYEMTISESLASATPVVAFNRGVISELVHHNETGFVVDSIAAAITAVQNIYKISRINCRQAFEKNFSARAMAVKYMHVFERLCGRTRKIFPMRPSNMLPALHGAAAPFDALTLNGF